jgi:hypothetical protein
VSFWVGPCEYSSTSSMSPPIEPAPDGVAIGRRLRELAQHLRDGVVPGGVVRREDARDFLRPAGELVDGLLRRREQIADLIRPYLLVRHWSGPRLVCGEGHGQVRAMTWMSFGVMTRATATVPPVEAASARSPAVALTKSFAPTVMPEP